MHLTKDFPGGSPNAARPILVLVEDDDGVRRGLQLLLYGQGYDVHAFASPAAALLDPAAVGARCLVVDYVLSESDGISMLSALRARGWDGLAVLITAYAAPEVRINAAHAGFAAVLAKPFRDDDLIRALNHGSKPAGTAATNP